MDNWKTESSAPYDTRVLVSGGTEVWLAWKDKRDGKWWTSDVHEKDVITHWTELPQPPKK